MIIQGSIFLAQVQRAEEMMQRIMDNLPEGAVITGDLVDLTMVSGHCSGCGCAKVCECKS